MALPDDPNQNKKIEGSGVVIDTSLKTPATERVVVIENESETIIPNLAKDEPEGHQDQISEQLSGGIDHMV